MNYIQCTPREVESEVILIYNSINQECLWAFKIYSVDL